jgi:hypothetical protein
MTQVVSSPSFLGDALPRQAGVRHDAAVSGGVGGRLLRDLKKAKQSQRGLARLLAEREGNLDEREKFDARWEYWRRQVSRWMLLDGKRGLTPENAAAVAEILGTDPDRYVSAQFSRQEQLKRQEQHLLEKLREVRKRLREP